MRRRYQTLGEAFTLGKDTVASVTDNVGWNWAVAKNQARCATCGHSRLHHLGFREPGCTYCGTCTCTKFVKPCM